MYVGWYVKKWHSENWEQLKFMLTFSQSKEVQFVYISVHKHPYLKLMASMETKYLKGLGGTYSQNRR